MLIEANALLPHGAWSPWLLTRVAMSGRTAQDYMRLAREPNAQRAADLSIRGALEQARAAEPARAVAHRADGPQIMLRTHLGREVAYPQPASPPTFNATNEHISWAAWSWNPVTGCLHGCGYCYAREIATSPTTRAYFPAGFTPVFHPERLSAPSNTKVPADVVSDPRRTRVFAGSMGDMYEHWVPREWNEQVHASCVANPEWDHLMLTKFPDRYLEFLEHLPPTAWLGTSVDEQKRVRLAERAFRQISGVRLKYLSLEPMREELRFTDLSTFDWVIVGAQTENSPA